MSGSASSPDQMLPAVAAYDERAADYDAWYDDNPALYQAELDLVAGLLEPLRALGAGLEIGAGTGRFAEPLGIDTGLEPSPRMAEYARERGVHIVQGLAEDLPFADGRFGYTAFLTSLCFVADAARALAEARRVTTPGGGIVVAFLNRDSDLGAQLHATKADDPFYATARFFTPEELARELRAAGYVPEAWRQLSPTSASGVPAIYDGADERLYCGVRAVRT